MQIAFHIGANCTDEDRLLKSILKNASTLLQQGIAVPGPGKYRSLIRETIQALDGEYPTQDTREILLDAIVEDDDITRLVMSNDNFIAVPKRIFDSGVFYPQAEMKVRGLHQLFATDQISLFMGLRNPVSFLQETAKRAEATSLGAYLGLQDPTDLMWSDVIRRIKRAAPDTPLCVWCNEDTPLIWEDLIRRISGIAADSPILGEYDVLSGIISETGLAALQARMDADPTADRATRHNMIADVMEEHALPEQYEDHIDLPELDADTIIEMTENYEDDLEDIAQMEGVELIMPFA